MGTKMISSKEKPKDIDEFKKWIKDKFNLEINEDIKLNYEQNVKALYKDIEGSSFWGNIEKKYNSYNDDYKIGKNLNLFINPDNFPQLLTKEYKDFLLKVYRKNVIENKNWPEPPIDNWILPNNWFEKIKDIIRTRFVVKYLDGVEDFVKKIETEANNCDLKFIVDYEAREEGYYAAHINIETNLKIYSIEGKIININFIYEIQVTTQLQEVLCSLLHKYYEERRIRIRDPNEKWQWNYKSEEFAPNYLGHILHYIEGMIMEIRNKKLN